MGGWVASRPGGRSAVLAGLVLAALGAAALSGPAPELDAGGPSHSVRLERSYGELPLSFAPAAAGQGFSATTDAGSVSLTGRGATILPAGRGAEPVRMTLDGAVPVALRAQDELPGVVNDLRGDDPSKWRTGVPTFARVRYPGVYPGTAVDFHGTSGTLEYDFRLAAGADPDRIEIDFHGAPIRITGSGALVVGTGEGRVRQAPPVAFQPGEGGRNRVPASFAVHGGRVGFELGAYDRSRPLVIDPLILSYATLLGGGDEDRVSDIAVDSTGAAYLTGYTLSNDFPTQGAYDSTRSNIDAFVTKLSPSGSSLVYSTLLGGSEIDFADSIAVDSSGNAFVTGQTHSTGSATELFPVAGGAYAPGLDEGSRGDVFVTKLNPTGNGPVYSSVFGGGYAEEARAIAIDSAGAAYVGGYSESYPGFTTAFPTTTGAYDETFNGTGSRDGFVTKLNPNGTRSYSTMLGGSGQDEVFGIDVDSLGRAYMTGFAAASSNNDFPTTPGNRYAPVDVNGTDAYLARLSANGSSLDYSTGIGTDGSGGNDGSDFGYAVAAGPTDGIAYITGGSRTGSGTDFPLVHQYQGRPGGCCTALDTFVAKFDTSQAGSASLLYSTLLGGTPEDTGSAIDVDSAGNAYVGGNGATGSGVPFPTTADELGGGTNRGNAYVTKIVQSGTGNATLGFSTTIPGAGSLDALSGLQYDEANGAVYVGGTSRNGTLPTTTGAYQTSGAGDRDGFAVKIVASNDSTPPNTTISGGPTNGSTVTANPVGFTFTADETSTFECKYDSGSYAPCTSPGPGMAGSDSRTLANGVHTFSVRAKDAANNVDASPDTRTFTVDVADTTPPDTSITSGPAANSTVASSNVTFGFSSTEGSSTFECSYDGAPFTACTSPGPGTTGSDTRTLANGPHTFAVRARDGSPGANVDATPATRAFTVKVASPPPPDTTPPETSITKAPPKKLKAKKKASVTVEFASSEGGSTFSCKVDGGQASGCSSPATFRLGTGDHTIAIAATDAAGNVDGSPATVDVTVKKKPKKKKHGGGKGGGKHRAFAAGVGL